MGLREAIQNEPISELALRPYVAVSPDTTVRETVQKMRHEKVGAAIVVDTAGKAIGLFNEKVLLSMLATNPAGMEEPISEHMARRLITLRNSDPIAKLIAMMQRHRARWVFIADEAGRPVALTGLRGVIEYVADYFPRLVKVQPFNLKVSVDEREGA